jgi:hypothetical protein
MTVGNTNTQTKVQTREIVIPYEDLVGYFVDAGMTVADSNQQFDVLIRRSLPNGNQDAQVARIGPDRSIVLQFNEVTISQATG